MAAGRGEEERSAKTIDAGGRGEGVPLASLHSSSLLSIRPKCVQLRDRKREDGASIAEGTNLQQAAPRGQQ